MDRLGSASWCQPEYLLGVRLNLYVVRNRPRPWRFGYLAECSPRGNKTGCLLAPRLRSKSLNDRLTGQAKRFLRGFDGVDLETDGKSKGNALKLGSITVYDFSCTRAKPDAKVGNARNGYCCVRFTRIVIDLELKVLAIEANGCLNIVDDFSNTSDVSNHLSPRIAPAEGA